MVGFERGAGQVVTQDIEPGAEEVLPAPGQMIEQRHFVKQHFAEAPIQRIVLRDPNVRAWKIVQGALLKPQPVQAPLAAWIEQAVHRQRQSDVMPNGAVAIVRQAYLPRAIPPTCSYE